MVKEEQILNNRKKIIIISASIVLLLALIVGISYAYWQNIKVQEDANIIASGCFGVELEGNNPIDLANSFPITTEDGMKTAPYTFTITNKCSESANYVVNLESLSNTTFQNTSIRVALNETDKLYSEYIVAEKYYDSSKESRSLISGTLESGGNITYNLRIWIDEEAPNSEQSKTFASKIVVTTGEGEIIKTLASKVELGDYISMTPTSTSYVIPAGITGYESSQEINPSELNLWRVIKKNEDGTVDVVSEYVSSETITLKGKTGYMNLVGVLNQIAAQYTNEKYVQNTRHMGYDNQIGICSVLSETDCPDDLGYKGDFDIIDQLPNVSNIGLNKSGTFKEYWLASRSYELENLTIVKFRTRFVKSDGKASAMSMVRNELEVELGYSVRPILTLKSNVEIISGDGKSEETAYTF